MNRSKGANKMELSQKHTWSHFKRFLELFYGDPGFREEFQKNPVQALEGRSLDLDAACAREAIEVMLAAENGAENHQNPYIELFSTLVSAVQKNVDSRSVLAQLPNQEVAGWIAKQRGRIAFESFAARQNIRAYTAFAAFELSEGCSGRCEFCCFAAESLKAVFPYSAENAQMWRGILEETMSVIGQATSVSPCYMATEPFDNPDYEKFLLDFRDITGHFPQTTTVASVKNLKRTRRFMEFLGEEALNHEAALRFSVTSLEQMKKIHEAFAPEELCGVELLLNNPESLYNYCSSGRARKLSRDTQKQFLDVSCSCVLGFRVNMVRKTIALVVPVVPDEEFPLGIKTYETRSFTDAKSYAFQMKDMIARWMMPKAPADLPLRMTRHIRVEKTNNKILFFGERVKRAMSGTEELRQAVCLLQCEKLSLEELSERLQLNEYQKMYVYEQIQKLFAFGYVDLE